MASKRELPVTPAATLNELAQTARTVISERTLPLSLMRYRQVIRGLLRDTLQQRPLNVNSKLVAYRVGDSKSGEIVLAVEIAVLPLAKARLLAKPPRRVGDGSTKSN